MIRSFVDKATEIVWNEQYVRLLDRRLQRAAMRKLEQLYTARYLKDLRVPSGNRLERLSGDRRGQYSIRVNAQWRICFAWRQGGAEDVEPVDYH